MQADGKTHDRQMQVQVPMCAERMGTFLDLGIRGLRVKGCCPNSTGARGDRGIEREEEVCIGANPTPGETTEVGI